MKRFYILIIVFIFITFLSFGNETIELLTTEYQPFCGGKGNTMWCEVINAAFALEGVDVTWKSFPQEREEAMVAEGENLAFLSGTLVITPEERPDFVMNDEPLIYVSVVAFFPKIKYPKGLQLKDANDLKGITVGAVRGTGSITVLTNAEANIDFADDKDMLIKKLVGGRYDIAVIGDLTGLGSLKEFYPLKVSEYGYEKLYNSPIDLIFSKKHPRTIEFKKKYDSGIAKLKADGTFMLILKKYYPNGEINREILTKDMKNAE